MDRPRSSRSRSPLRPHADHQRLNVELFAGVTERLREDWHRNRFSQPDRTSLPFAHIGPDPFGFNHSHLPGGPRASLTFGRSSPDLVSYNHIPGRPRSRSRSRSPLRSPTDRVGQELKRKAGALTGTQNYHMRHSPPIQPGEQNNHGRLPSFHELLQGTQQTPPGTPSRRNGSADSSPHGKPALETPAWNNPGHRRHDTLIDIHHHQRVTDAHAVDHRRISSIGSQSIHQRQSLSFPPPPLSASHYHRPASPSPPIHSSYHQTHAALPAHYSHAPSLHSPAYDPRTGQHYGMPSGLHFQDPYYGRPSYGHMQQPSHQDFRFQQHIGANGDGLTRRRRGNLPKEATSLLKAWYHDHKTSPYPNEEQKAEMSRQTGLTQNQISNWFINARRREPHREQRERERASQNAGA